MLKTILCCIIFALSSLNAELINVPNEFSVKEQFFSWSTSFNIETNNELIGTVHRKIFSWTPEYHLKNTQSELLAVAKMRFWSFWRTFDVTNTEGLFLGSVNQKLSWFFPTFEIRSSNDYLLANAELNFWKTTWTITDPIDNHTIATLSRPFFRFKSDWDVKIYDMIAFSEKGIHPHMFLTLMAFQVDREYWQAINNNNSTFNNSLAFAISKNETLEKYTPELENFREILNDIEPSEEDFLFIETLVTNETIDPSLPEEIRYEETFNSLLNHLTSDQLTKQQKAALFLLLDYTLQR